MGMRIIDLPRSQVVPSRLMAVLETHKVSEASMTHALFQPDFSRHSVHIIKGNPMEDMRRKGKP